jgi:transposase-like protein
MKREQRYGITSLAKDFPNDDACLDFLFDAQHSRSCSCGGSYRRIVGRKQYQCSKCRFQIAPTAGTIFHKSDTPLTLWFKAILAFSNAKSGVSAKYMERELEVTYKTAWRMLTMIRKALGQKGDKLKGDVETDAAYFGGKKSGGKNNSTLSQAVAAKSVVMAVIQRKGDMRAEVVPNMGTWTTKDFIEKHVEKGSRLITDGSKNYERVAVGYDRHSVDHHKGEYVRGDVYVNNVESFWGHVKRSMKGTHKVVSKKHLQEYLDGFVFHYNNRYSDKERFGVLLGTLLRGAR